MVPKGVVKELSSRLFYTSDAAMYSAFVSLFSPNIKGGEYVHNSPGIMIDTQFGIWLFGKDSKGLQQNSSLWKPLVFIMQCFYQSIYYKNIVYGKPNDIVLDNILTEKLYQWSKSFAK